MNDFKDTDMFDVLNNNLNELALRISYLCDSNENKTKKICDSVAKLNECIAYINYDIDETIARNVSCDYPQMIICDKNTKTKKIEHNNNV